MSSLQTRKTTASDFNFIYNLHRQTLYSYVEQTWGWKEEVQLNGIREEFDNLLFKIVCHEGIDIGVISVIEQEDALFLNYLAIMPLHQRKGLGTQILDKLLEQAVIRGISVKLSVMQVNPAKALYERLGFRVVGSGENTYLMEWRNL